MSTKSKKVFRGVASSRDLLLRQNPPVDCSGLPGRGISAFLRGIILLICCIVATDAFGQANCVPAPSGLVGWWPGNGNAVDIAGGNNGTLVNGVTYAPAEVGEGFDFTTAGAAVLLNNTSSLRLQNFTIEGWIQRASASAVTETPNLNGDGIIFGFGVGGYAFGFRSDGTLFLTQTYESNIDGSIAVTDTNLHHVAVTTSGGIVCFLLDGVAYPAGTYAPDYSFSGPAAIGGPGDLGLANFYGVVNAIAVYNRALSTNEIAAIYNAGSAGKCANEIPPAFVQPPLPVSSAIGGSAAFFATINGTAPFGYQWLFNATNLLGATSEILIVTNLTLDQAGAYSLAVTNLYGSATSSAAVLAVAYPLDLGQVVTNGVPFAGDGELLTTNQVDNYVFDAPTDLLVYLNAFGWPAGGAYWTLYGPNGAAVFANQYMPNNNIGRLRLPLAGSYQLAVSTYNGSTGPYSFEITGIQPFDYTLGTVVTNGVPLAGEGNLIQPGGQDYLFRAPTNLLVYVNALGWPRGGALWALFGPDGRTVFENSYMPNNSVGRLQLPLPGTYRLAVSSYYGSVGTYSFQIAAIQNQPFNYTLGTVVTNGAPLAGEGNLVETGEQDYVFTAPTNLLVYVNALSWPTGGALWTLSGPDGGTVFQNSYMPNNSVGRLQLPLPGTYRLAVSSYNGSTGTYSFEIAAIQNQPFNYTLGTVVTNGAPLAGEGNLVEPGEQDYVFTAPTNLLVYVNALGWPTGGAYWTLSGPNGSTVFQNAYMPNNSVGRLQLPLPGTYRLAVSSYYGSTGPYSFQITDSLVQQFDYTVGTLLTNGVPLAGEGNLTEPGEADVYTFTAPANLLVNIDSLGWPGGGAYFQLYGPGGITVFSTYMQNFGNERVQLPVGGTYRLVVESQSGDTGPYSFQITSLQDHQFNYAVGTVVTNGSPLAGEGILIKPGEADTYVFTAPPNLLVNINSLNWPGGGAYFQLYGPGGITVFSTYMQNFGNERVQLPVGGTYRLVVESQSGDTGPYSFQITSITDKSFRINVGQTVGPNVPATGAGILSGPGERDLYTFQGTGGQIVQFVDENASSYATWTVFAPDTTQLFSSQLSGNGASLQTLPMNGTYTVMVQGGTSTPIDYSFAILNAGTNPTFTPPNVQTFPIALDTMVTNGAPSAGAGNLETPAAEDIYTFTVTNGQTIFLQDMGSSSPYTALYRIYDPYGSQLGGNWLIGGNNFEQTLGVAGTYTIVVNDNGGNSTCTYGFALLGVPRPNAFNLELGQVVTNGVPGPGAGEIAVAGASATYAFTVTNGQTIFLQDLGSSSSYLALCSVYDPYGNRIFQNWLNGGNNFEQTLGAAGTYTITVNNNGGFTTGTYSFALLGVNISTNAFNITLGQVVTNGVPGPGAGNLETSGAEDFYTFSVANGQTVFLQDLGSSSSYLALCSVYDPYGARIFQGWLNGGGNFEQTLGVAGTYTISVNNNSGSATGTYSFALLGVNIATNTFNLALGQVVTNGVPGLGAGNLETPGAEDFYTFTATNGQTVFLQDLGSSANYLALCSIYDPYGARIFQGWLNGGGNFEQTLGAAGTYTISVNNNGGSATGTYSFALLGVNVAANTFNIALGQAVGNGVAGAGAGNLETPGAEDIYTFTATNGQTVFLEDLGSSSSYLALCSVYDPYGIRIFQNWLNGGNNFEQTLGAAGNYTVMVNNNGGSATGTYSFALLGVPPSGASNTFNLELGQVVTNGVPGPGAGIIPAPGASDLYTFAVTAGQTIFLRDFGSSSSYLALCSVYDPYGNRIFQNWLNGGNNFQQTLGATGSLTIVVNNNGGSDTGTYSFAVDAVNVAPITTVIQPQFITEFSTLTLSNVFLEPGVGTTVTYSLLAAPAGMSVDANGVIRWMPAQTQSPGTNVVNAVATSTGGANMINPQLSVTNRFVVVVLEVNVAPVLPVVPARTVNELSLLTVTNTATETNIHATVTYALVSPPAGVSISADGVITWTPTQTQSPGTNTITTIATSTDPLDPVRPQLTATNSFTVVVREVNLAPVLPVIALQAVNELTPLTVTNTATDYNIHASVSYSLLNPPSGMTINAVGVISWIPAQTQSPATNTITTVATSADAFDQVHPVLSATNTFNVIVGEVNVAPSLPVIAAQTVNELNPLTVTNTATEPNIHSTLGYSLVNPLAGVTISSSGVITWTPGQTQSPGTNIITTVAISTNVFDQINPRLSATNSFTVVVKEVNVTPSLPVIAAQTVNELTLLLVTNTASEPNIHSSVSYSLINPPAGMTISAGGLIAWTPGQNQSPGTNTIITVVTGRDTLDQVNPILSATNSFTVIVREVNVAPSLPIIAAQTVDELTLLTITNTATEPNVHTSVGYTLVNPPAGVAISANGVITWRPGQNQSPGTNTITTVATGTNTFDQSNPLLSATNSFIVIVREVNVTPSLPVIAAQSVYELSQMTVTNTATEPNIHATLAYSLVNPPAGAAISAAGVISWTPGVAQSPSTNVITTVVTATDVLDAVNPVLSATNAFTTIVIRPVLAITSPRWLGNGQFQFSFVTASGLTYMIEYSTDLRHWTSLTELEGSGGTLTVVDPNATNAHRFYRLVYP